MPRAKERRIILPDALPLPGKKPGPSERQSDSYLALSAALRSKELLSQWLPAGDGEESSELQLREALTRTLFEHGSFGYIRESSKLPHSHPRDGSKIHYSMRSQSGSAEFLRPNGTEWLGSATAPAAGNWSVIPAPGSRLLIFDLDVAKSVILDDGSSRPTDIDERYLEARRSLGHLEDLLGLKLHGTYAQLSPSGGIHIFVLLPEGTDPGELPSAKISDGMRSVAGVPPEAWAKSFRGDIRSGASNGFILMAGSQIRSEDSNSRSYYRPLVTDSRWSDFKDYRSGRKLRLIELPESAVDRLRRARRMDLDARTPRNSSTRERAAAKELILTPRSTRELQSSNYRKLVERLAADAPRSFHAARAHIYRALSCCATPEAIAELCRDAGYGRDTHRGRELSDGELLADMESMDRRGFTAERCGSHCGALWGESTGSDDHRAELEALVDSIRAERLAPGVELDAAGYQRMEESSLLEARSTLRIRSQRDSSYGVYGKRKPLGLSYGEIVRELLGDRSYSARSRGEVVRVAAYRLRALELMVGYFGPLFGAGASAAIAPAEELMGLFGWSRSQLREALRFLRSSGVISLEHRQVTGRAATYAPGFARFFDSTLGSKMRAAWGRSKVENSAGQKAFLGGVFDYSRGKIVRPDGSSFSDFYLQEVAGSFTGLLWELDLDLPRAISVGSTVVSRYLSKALEHYKMISESDGKAAAREELRELAAELHSAESLQRSWIKFDLFETSRTASCEDRGASDPVGSIHGRSLWRRRGDRSPPGSSSLRDPHP